MAGQSSDYLDLQAKATKSATLLSQKAAEATAQAKALRDRADLADDPKQREDLARQSQEATDRAARFVQATGQADHQADLYGKAATTQAKYETAQDDADRLRERVDDAYKRGDAASDRGIELRRDVAAAQGKADRITQDIDGFKQGVDTMREELKKAEADGNDVRAQSLREGIAQNEQRIAKWTDDLRQAKVDVTRIQAQETATAQQARDAMAEGKELTTQADAKLKEARDDALQADAYANEAEDKYAPDPKVLEEAGASDDVSPPDDQTTPATPDGQQDDTSVADAQQSQDLTPDPSDLDDASAPASTDGQQAAASSTTDRQDATVQASTDGSGDAAQAPAGIDDLGAAAQDAQAPDLTAPAPEPELTAPDLGTAAVTDTSDDDGADVTADATDQPSNDTESQSSDVSSGDGSQGFDAGVASEPAPDVSGSEETADVG